MSAAYFIVLDNSNPGFDTFVNGKAIVADAPRLSTLCKSIGLKPPEAYFAMSTADAEAMSDEFDVDASDVEPEQWFDAEEGLTWVAALRSHIGQIRQPSRERKRSSATSPSLRACLKGQWQSARSGTSRSTFELVDATIVVLGGRARVGMNVAVVCRKM